MGKKAESLASSSLVAGLFLGIYFYTGISVDPQDLLGMVAQDITGQLAPQYASMVTIALVVLSILGIWQTITMILSGSNFGLFGLIMTISGFVGGITLFFVPIVGIILIILSVLIGGYL